MRSSHTSRLGCWYEARVSLVTWGSLLILLAQAAKLELDLHEDSFEFLSHATDIRKARTERLVFWHSDIQQEFIAEYDVVEGDSSAITADICRQFGGCDETTTNQFVQEIDSKKQKFQAGLYEDLISQILLQDPANPPHWLHHGDETCRQQWEIRVQASKQILARNLTEPGGPGAWCARGENLAQARAIGACPLAVARAALLLGDGGGAGEGARAGAAAAPPGDAAAWMRVSAALFKAHELEAAQAALLSMLLHEENSLEAKELELEVDINLATIATSQGRADVAARAYARALAHPGLLLEEQQLGGGGRRAGLRVRWAAMVPPLMPSYRALVDFRAQWLDRVRALTDEWRDSGGALGADPAAAVGWTPFHLAHQGENDRVLQEALSELYSAAAPALNYTSPYIITRKDPVKDNRAQEKNPVRIGFLSIYLRDHSIGRMLAHLIAALARRPTLEIHTFIPDFSGDHVYDYISSNANKHHVISATELELTRNEVKEAHLDVLLLCDVGMEPLSYFLGFSRLALVQAAWWGHPATTSAPEVDYFISLDAEEDHAAFDYYSEQLVRMEIINVAPFTMVDTAEEEEAAEEGKEGAGGGEKEKKKGPPLPGAAPVLPPPDAELYLVLGRLFKLHPDFDLAIIEILKGHANAHVVLIAEKHNNQITSLLWHRIKATVAENDRHILSRLVFVHHWNYVAALRHAAAVLDTYPYGGCLTSLEALSHLRPLVTLPSAHVKGRFTLAMYKQMEDLGLVVPATEEAQSWPPQGYSSAPRVLGREDDKGATTELARASAALRAAKTYAAAVLAAGRAGRGKIGKRAGMGATGTGRGLETEEQRRPAADNYARLQERGEDAALEWEEFFMRAVRVFR